MRKPISFVVITNKNYHTLARCLDSIEAAARPFDELILVLNNPDSQTKMVALERSHWQVLHEPTPGPQHARNLGARSAKNELLCFLDADIQISNEWPEIMALNFQNPWVVMGQSSIKVESLEGILSSIKQHSYANFSSQFYKSGITMVQPSLDTATLMVRKEWFIKVGGFDQNFSRLEDTDFSLRVLYHGGDIFYEDRIAAIEMFDPDENVWSFFKKRYHSATYLPLLIKKHCMNYYLPFFNSGQIFVPRKFWDVVFKFIELIGLANSSHTLVVSTKHWISYLAHPKKQALGLVKNPNLRSIWVGGEERSYDLLSQRFY